MTKALALGMVAFWALMGSHCGLESIPGLDFFACSTQNGAEHQPSDCETDACAAIESGLYKTEQAQVSAHRPDFAPLALVLALVSDPAALQSAARRASPPELIHTWQFFCRTALPPRAPSFLS